MNKLAEVQSQIEAGLELENESESKEIGKKVTGAPS